MNFAKGATKFGMEECICKIRYSK